jgi:hypothetical protein
VTWTLAVALGALAIAVPGASAQTGAQCPTFTVLHNDRIGPATLPKGSYSLELQGANLTCASASKLFSRFLQDYDGKLPPPWRVQAQGKGSAAFKQGNAPGFEAALIKGGGSASGGGGGDVPSPLGTLCPGKFQVEHDDMIGRLSFPKGNYELVIPRGSIISCGQAAKLFARFLGFPAGNLPKLWAIKGSSALFFKPGNPNPRRKRFRVDPAT